MTTIKIININKENNNYLNSSYFNNSCILISKIETKLYISRLLYNKNSKLYNRFGIYLLKNNENTN